MLWLVLALAVLIVSFAVGWSILPSPKRCLDFSCDFIPDAALVLRQHPLSWDPVAFMGGGLVAAISLSVLGFPPTESASHAPVTMALPRACPSST
jgi:hypothetical protein